VASLNEVPPDFAIIDPRAFAELSRTDLAGWAEAPHLRVSELRVADPSPDAGPAYTVRHTGLAYRPFPPPDELPGFLDARLRRLYRQFYEQREELARFRTRPTEELYRLWHDLLLAKDIV
jgi:hypothetical protein